MVGLPGDTPFLFLRHGETAANAADTVAGSLDLPLTPEGERQAAAAARRIASLPRALVPATVWSSPLVRARRTAEAVAARLGRGVRLHPGLAERDWGAWEGRPRPTLRRDATPPGGESPLAFEVRVAAALAALDGPAPLLVVGHSGVQRVLFALTGATGFRRPGNGELLLWAPAAGGWTCRTIGAAAGDTELS